MAHWSPFNGTYIHINMYKIPKTDHKYYGFLREHTGGSLYKPFKRHRLQAPSSSPWGTGGDAETRRVAISALARRCRATAMHRSHVPGRERYLPESYALMDLGEMVSSDWQPKKRHKKKKTKKTM